MKWRLMIMKEGSINSLSIKLKVDLGDIRTCNLLFNSLELESDYNPNDRAKANLTQDDYTLIIEIDAKDTVSARASINSYIKWINTSLQIVKLAEIGK